MLSNEVRGLKQVGKSDGRESIPLYREPIPRLILSIPDENESQSQAVVDQHSNAPGGNDSDVIDVESLNDTRGRPNSNFGRGGGWKSVSYRGRGGQNNRVRPNLTQQNGGRPNLEPAVSKPRPVPFNGPRQEVDKARPSYSQAVRTGVKNKVVRGSMEASEGGPLALKTVQRMSWMFLSGFTPSVDTEAVRAYLNSLNGSVSYVCEQLKTKYDTYSSFKVGVPLELANDLMHPNLWPQGCIISKYKAPRNKANVTNDKPSTDFLDNTNQGLTQP